MSAFPLKIKIILFAALTASSSHVTNACALSQSSKDMVATSQYLATNVGLSILEQGGNAIDAAVAIGYALAVVEPCCGNLGGGGFMLLRTANGKVTFLNFREKAPLSATPALYQDKNGEVDEQQTLQGYKAVATPGTVLGLDTALTRYGTFSRKKVMEPAIKLAKEGYILTPFEANRMQGSTEFFLKDREASQIFLNHKKPYKAGERFVQTKLARTLTHIANHGSRFFYEGPIAASIVDESHKNRGWLTKKDFKNYTIEEQSPLVCHYHTYTVYTAPPPSSGGVALCEMLEILEDFPMAQFGFHSPQSVHYLAEAMRQAYFDRNTLGDPNFVHNNIEELLSRENIQKIDHKIPQKKALKLGNSIEINAEGYDTTHYTVVDRQGNAVSVTYTINGFFGAKVMAKNTGFFLNNEMNDFSAAPHHVNQFGLVQGENNKIMGGKRPLSSMAPTILTLNHKLFLALGTPGGARIPTTLLETILNVVDYHMNLQDAVDAPRLHHQWMPDVIYEEPSALSALKIKQLEEQGYHFQTQPEWNAVEAILYDTEKNILYGANDVRRPAGKAAGNEDEH